MGELNFEWALNKLKQGKKIFRTGWNGKGMFIVLQEGYLDGIPANSNTANALKIQVGTALKFLPYIMMKTVAGSYVPWVASHTDILSSDWDVL